MTLSAQISRPSDRDLHIVALLSTENGRRSAMVSSIQCLLSVVGSMGIILLFAGIPQLIYSPVVTSTNVVIFLVGALLLSIMVAGNACLSYRFRSDLNQISSPMEESVDAPVDDKPPSYDDLSFLDVAPPDYYSVVCDSKSARSSVGNVSVEVAPTHARAGVRREHKSCSPESSRDNLWSSVSAVDVTPRSLSFSSPDAFSRYPEVLDTTQATGADVSRSQRSTYPDIYDTTSILKRGRLSSSSASVSPLSLLVNSHATNHRAVGTLSDSVTNSRCNFSEAKKSDSTASSPNSERSFIFSPKVSECHYPLSATDAAALPTNFCATTTIRDLKSIS